MRTRSADSLPWIALAVSFAATISWLGLGPFAWNDYHNEALPSVNALVNGHLSRFFALAPAYGGSLLERAPFAIAPGAWGGGQLAVYRMMALPCIVVCGALGLWLVARMRRDGRACTACFLALGLCVANPMMVTALESGHPEELLGGALCVVAVLLAACERPVWAGLAVGAAIANKQWALLALGPMLLALPGRRMLCMSVAAAASAVLFVPFVLSASSSFGDGVRAAASPDSTIFLPSQLWWFLGSQHMDGYRVAPAWVGPVSHPLIVALGVPLTLVTWWGSRRTVDDAGTGSPGIRASPRAREADALLLLALLLALRFMLDPWDNVYYPVPFVLALVAWEVLVRRRAPLLAATATAAVWAGQHWVAPFASADTQAAFFAAWSVPLAVLLAAELHGPAIRSCFKRSAPLGAASPTAPLDLGVRL